MFTDYPKEACRFGTNLAVTPTTFGCGTELGALPSHI
jgi:hypothetical protein